MSIERIIESIGLNAATLKHYLLAEIDEFLSANEPSAREEEFGDILFALLCMSWAHAGKHYALDADAFEAKVRRRLRSYGTLSRHEPKYLDSRIPELEFGIVHLAFGQFEGQWAAFDPLKNGTTAEIQLLTDAPFERADMLTNHCIVTFADTETIVFDFLDASADMSGGNTVRCRIPDLLFARAKRELDFNGSAAYMALQVLAALERLRILPGAVVHFHSWETGFLFNSEEFRSFVGPFKTIFSPYLTAGRLQSLMDGSKAGDWTLSAGELSMACHFERKLCEACMRVVVEGARDRDFYNRWVHRDRLEVRSFARERVAFFDSKPNGNDHLAFIAGGRPVREKGFLELCKEFALVHDWAAERGLTATLSILCREQRRDKGAEYIRQMEEVIIEHGLEKVIIIEPKVSLETLRRRIAGSAAIIAPSLYDPFCLMPTYAIDVGKPAFVSCYAGVSENIKSRDFTFDPKLGGDLLRAILTWYDEGPTFEFESCFPSYHDIYLAKELPQPWGVTNEIRPKVETLLPA